MGVLFVFLNKNKIKCCDLKKKKSPLCRNFFVWLNSTLLDLPLNKVIRIYALLQAKPVKKPLFVNDCLYYIYIMYLFKIDLFIILIC